MTDRLGRTLPQADSSSAFLEDVPALRLPRPGDPLYKTRIGLMFDQKWVKGARDLLRTHMTEPPDGVTYDAPQAEEDWTAAEARPLDLADWEKDVVMYSL